MDNKLFEDLKGSMEHFNAGALFDIPTGQLLDGGIKRGEYVTFAAFLRKTGPNYALIGKWRTTLEGLKPNTLARWVAATNLLRYLGYSVTWTAEDVCPVVHWVNTEGNGDEEAKMIEDILHRDFTIEPRTEVSPLSGEELYANMKKALISGAERIVFDSITQDSTHQS